MSDAQIFDGISDDEFLTMMHELGIQGELVRSSDGRGYIKAPVGPMWFVVYFFSGRGETSNTVASFVTFIDMRLTAAFHNYWNRVHLFPKASAGNGNTVLEMNIVLRGVTKAYVSRCLGIWQNAVSMFLEEAGQFLEFEPDVSEGP